MREYTFTVGAATVRPCEGNHAFVDVTMEIDASDILGVMEANEFLEAIGREEAKRYFGLVEGDSL